MTVGKLSVIVAGAGIGGLTAAIALRREGHSVVIYEKASLSHEIGQGITLSSNGGRILRELGLNFDKAQAADYLGTNVVNAQTLEPIAPYQDYSSWDKDFGIRMKTANRIDLHAALVDLARDEHGVGEPVQIFTRAGVKGFDGDNGSVTLDSGQIVQGDLVVAADGIHSHAASHINGSKCPKIESNTTIVYRFTLPSKSLRADPDTAPLLAAGDGVCTFNVDPSGGRWLVRYYSRGSEICTFALYSIRDLDNDQMQDHELRYKTDRRSLQKEMDGFHHALLKAAGMASDVLPLWRCTTREPLSKLHRGRLVIIGDAAHPVFPHIGIGAVSAIEDAGFLGRLFRDIPSSSEKPKVVADRLAIFTKYRLPRVAAYKYYSDVPFFRKAVDEQKDKVERFMKPSDLPASQGELRPWYMSYDALKEAEEALKEAGLC